MRKIYSVAVDGPSGAGKSTLSKAVAAELGIVYVDTGAIYRTIGYYVFSKNIDPKDAAAVIAVLPQLEIEMRYADDGLQHMYLNGQDVTKEIRLPQISMYASNVSAIPEVRTFLLEMQREMARRSCVIMDGRDIGTVVLPDAEVKIFLTADVEVRAQRRWEELRQRGTERPYKEVLREMEERDFNDSHRAAAPLKQADDAVLVETSVLGFEESKAKMLQVIREKVGI
ncbi:MAG: (d)CMP kinase [Ruminococcaceae bacterium]|nr:(d)CMP kinase [Oscillospiraceae bacterium]